MTIEQFADLLKQHLASATVALIVNDLGTQLMNAEGAPPEFVEALYEALK